MSLKHLYSKPVTVVIPVVPCTQDAERQEDDQGHKLETNQDYGKNSFSTNKQFIIYYVFLRFKFKELRNCFAIVALVYFVLQ